MWSLLRSSGIELETMEWVMSSGAGGDFLARKSDATKIRQSLPKI